MSVFASHTTTTIAVPHDPPQTVTIRKLRGQEHQDAQTANLRSFVTSKLNGRDWAGKLRTIVDKSRAGAAVTAADLSDPLDGYDRMTVVRSALIGWSYTDHPPTPDEIADLDDDTLDFIAREILRLSKPQLFVGLESAQKEITAPVPGVNGTGAAAD